MDAIELNEGSSGSAAVSDEELEKVLAEGHRGLRPG